MGATANRATYLRHDQCMFMDSTTAWTFQQVAGMQLCGSQLLNGHTSSLTQWLMPGQNIHGTRRHSSLSHEYSNVHGGGPLSTFMKWGCTWRAPYQSMGITPTYHAFCALTLLCSFSPPPAGWTHLPDPRGPSGIRSRQSMCVGCHKGIRRTDPQHLCRFATTGFDLDGLQFVPVVSPITWDVFSVGEPFRSRLPRWTRTGFPTDPHCSSIYLRSMHGSRSDWERAPAN